MIPYLLYGALLVLWPPLLWPAWRLRGRARVSLLVVATAGLVALGYETWMFLGTISAIRLDIPLISIALGGLYGWAMVVLVLARWRKAAAALGLAVVLIGGAMAYQWVMISRESARLSAALERRNALLFDAKFRDRATYERYFGPFAGGSATHPTGYWQAPSDDSYTRLIINPAGAAWLFYRCGDTECGYGPGGTGIEIAGAPSERVWQTTLKRRVGAPMPMRLIAGDDDRLSVEIYGRVVPFAKTLPPTGEVPARSSLTYLGPFAALACRRRHADVRQVWLWRDGARLYAVGIFSTLVAGAHAGFVTPIVLGEAVEAGGGWTFEWDRDGRFGRVTIALEGPGAALDLAVNRRRPERIVLAADPIFRDEAIELAPVTDQAAWRRWFDTVLVAHFAAGDIPACSP